MKTIVLACVLSLLGAAGCGQQKNPVGAAKLQLKRHAYAAAIKTLRGAPPEVRNTYAAQILLARAYRGASQYDNSINAYKKAASLDKKQTAPFVGMAEVAEELGGKATSDREKAKHQMRALAYCNAAMAVDDTNAEVYGVRARLYEARGELEKALEDREKAIARDPDNASYRLDQAKTLLRLKRPDEASVIVEKAITRGASAEALELKADMILATRKPGAVKEARTLLERAVAEEGTKPEVRGRILSTLSSLCLELNDLDGARKWLAQLEKYPRFRGQAMFQKGSILVREKEWKEAYDQFKLLESTNIPQVLVQLAFVEERLDMQNQAIGHYKKVAELVPKYLPAHLALARLFLVRGLYQESMKHCNAALAEQPGNEAALRYRARIRRMPSGKLHSRALARIDYLKILLQKPNSVSANLDIADLYIEQGQPGMAINHANRANAIEDSPRAHLTLGRAYLLLHQAGQKPAQGPPNLERATTHLEKAYAGDKESFTAVRWLANAYAAAEKLNMSNKAIVLLRDHIGRNPRQGQVYIALAEQLERMGDLSEAVKTMVRAALVRGIRGFDIGLLGRAQFLAGDYKGAISTWEQMLTGARAEAGVPVIFRLGLATALASEGQHAKAQTCVGAAIFEGGQKQAGTVLLAACLAIQAGHYGRATQLIDTHEYPSTKAKQPYLDFVEACRKAGEGGKRVARLMNEGLMCSEFNNPKGAMKRFVEAAQLLPDSTAPLYVQISALVRASRFEDIPRIFKALFKKSPQDGFAHYQYAMMKDRLPVSIEQRAHLELALDFDPELAAAHVALAELLLRESLKGSAKARSAELLGKALSHSEEASRLQGGGTRQSLEQTARVHYAITKLRRTELLEEENPDEIDAKRTLAKESATATRAFLQKLKDKFPSSVEVIKTFIRFELIEKEYGTAVGLAGEFIENHKSDDRQLRVLLCEALIKQGKHAKMPKLLERARAELNRLIAADPLYMPAYRTLVNLFDLTERSDLVARTLARMRALDRSNPRIALKLALAYIEINQPADAMAIYEDILASIKRAPAGPTTFVLRRLATVGSARCITLMPTSSEAERVANIKKAVAALAPLSSVSPDGPPYVDAMLLRGELFEKLGKSSEALRLYREAQALAPKHYRTLRSLVVFHCSQREYGKLVELMREKVIPLREYDPFEQSRLALALVARNAPGDIAAAQAAVAKARDLMSRRDNVERELAPELSELYHHARVLVHVAAKKYHDARTVAKKGTVDAMQRSAYVRIIDACVRDATKKRAFVVSFADYVLFSSHGAMDEAVARLKEALKRFPGNYYLLTRLGSVYNRMNEMGKVADTLEQRIIASEAPGSVMTESDRLKLHSRLISTYLVRLAPHTPETIRKADAACIRALKRWPREVELLAFHATVRGLQRDKEQLVVALKRLIAAAKEGETEWVHAQKRLAIEYSLMEQHDKALEVCNLIERYTRSDARWQNNWAWLLATAPTPDFEGAIARADRAKTLSPTSAEIRDTLGWILHLGGKYSRAHVELNYAAVQKPKDASIQYHLGANYVELGKHKEALQALERALTLVRNGAEMASEDRDACKKLAAATKAKLPAVTPKK